jgi:hypothetical protein
MAPRHVFWVSPSGLGWIVRHQGSGQLHAFSTKAEAIEYARNWARANQPSQVKVQFQSGVIETEWTYGADPVRYPG